MKKITTGVLAMLLAGSLNATELTGTPEELKQFLQSQVRTVTLHEEATETGYTDIAKVTLVIRTKARDLAQSMEDNNEKRQDIVSTLTSAGVPADDIKSSNYSTSPQFGWFGSKPNSFEVVNTMEVTVSDDALFRMVAELADKDDDITFGKTEFEHSEKEAYEDKVRDKAVDSILEEAAYFENKLGLTLTPVTFNFSEVDYGSRMRHQFGFVDEVVVTGNRASSVAPAQAPVVPSFDEVEYRVSVAVVFEVVTTE